MHWSQVCREPLPEACLETGLQLLAAFTSFPNLSLICRVVSTLVYTKSNVIPHVVTFSWFNSTFLHSIDIDHLDLDTSDHLGPPYTICSGSDTTSDYLRPSQPFWDLLTLTGIISHIWDHLRPIRQRLSFECSPQADFLLFHIHVIILIPFVFHFHISWKNSLHA